MQDRKDINILVGANIKRERERAGLTQETFSEMIGLGPKSVSAIERGTVGVSLATLKKICTVLSVSSDALLFDAVAKNDTKSITSRLERLSPKQYEIAEAMLSNLLEAFSLDE